MNSRWEKIWSGDLFWDDGVCILHNGDLIFYLENDENYIKTLKKTYRYVLTITTHPTPNLVWKNRA